ncbi:MAG: hypothetical protein V4772_20335, partial [Pseudomonadota bacterium]
YSQRPAVGFPQVLSPIQRRAGDMPACYNGYRYRHAHQHWQSTHWEISPGVGAQSLLMESIQKISASKIWHLQGEYKWP